MLRGHRDLVDRAAYDEFLREAVIRRNRRNAAAFRVKRERLKDLPLMRTTDCVEEEARITRCSTLTVRGILYRAPSRLIGHRLKVRVYGRHHHPFEAMARRYFASQPRARPHVDG